MLWVHAEVRTNMHFHGFHISPQPPVAFSMTQKPGPPDQPGAGNAMNQFFIDNVQYCPDCANKTMTLNVPQEWIITNGSTPQHPFHIHTNPHQLVEQGSIINGQLVPFRTYNPPVWGDTIDAAGRNPIIQSKSGRVLEYPGGPDSTTMTQ